MPRPLCLQVKVMYVFMYVACAANAWHLFDSFIPKIIK